MSTGNLAQDDHKGELMSIQLDAVHCNLKGFTVTASTHTERGWHCSTRIKTQTICDHDDLAEFFGYEVIAQLDKFGRANSNVDDGAVTFEFRIKRKFEAVKLVIADEDKSELECIAAVKAIVVRCVEGQLELRMALDCDLFDTHLPLLGRMLDFPVRMSVNTMQGVLPFDAEAA